MFGTRHQIVAIDCSDASTSFPSDSFPEMVGPVNGGGLQTDRSTQTQQRLQKGIPNALGHEDVTKA